MELSASYPSPDLRVISVSSAAKMRSEARATRQATSGLPIVVIRTAVPSETAAKSEQSGDGTRTGARKRPPGGAAQISGSSGTGQKPAQTTKVSHCRSRASASSERTKRGRATSKKRPPANWRARAARGKGRLEACAKQNSAWGTCGKGVPCERKRPPGGAAQISGSWQNLLRARAHRLQRLGNERQGFIRRPARSVTA
jgi:hypothetical protein